MLDFIAWVIVGGLMGGLASMAIRAGEEKATPLYVMIGVVGAFLAGLMVPPLLGVTAANDTGFSLPALILALLGAVGLLVVIHLFRRGPQL